MARNNNNILVQGFSGAVGKQLVLRIRGGKTFLVNRPVKKKGRVPTAAQKAMQVKFREAVIYAKTAIQNAALKLHYQAVAQPGQSAYHAAFKDACRGPELSNLNTERYSGKVGDRITVRAVDNIFVDIVRISILAADGAILETGAAERDPNGLDFRYTITQPNANLAGTTIRVVAEDLPRNRTFLEVVL